MKKELLFVREKAKDKFIKDANEIVKFVNKVFKEAQKLGFDKTQAWEITKFAYNRPTPPQLDRKIRQLIVSGAGALEIGGAKIAMPNMIEMVEVPDLSVINDLIEEITIKKTHLGGIPFEKIKNEKNIEIESEFLTKRIESFNVYTENELEKKVFQAFTNYVEAVNILASDHLHRRYFETMEMDGFLEWRSDRFVIKTSPYILEKLRMTFSRSLMKDKQTKRTGAPFSGE